jgi:hypothetical protein
MRRSSPHKNARKKGSHLRGSSDVVLKLPSPPQQTLLLV